MSKKELQNDIKRNNGYILSDGTLNLQHLLPKAYDLIITYNLRGYRELLAEIRSCFVIQEDTFHTIDGGLFRLQYHGMASLEESLMERASDIWNESIFNVFNELTPNHYYFGSSEGDGACIGWFQNENS